MLLYNPDGLPVASPLEKGWDVLFRAGIPPEEAAGRIFLWLFAEKECGQVVTSIRQLGDIAAASEAGVRKALARLERARLIATARASRLAPLVVRVLDVPPDDPQQLLPGIEPAPTPGLGLVRTDGAHRECAPDPPWGVGGGARALEEEEEEGRKDSVDSEEENQIPSFLRQARAPGRAGAHRECAPSRQVGWAEAKAGLIASGLGAFREAINIAKEHRHTPRDVLIVCASYEKLRGESPPHRWYGPGVIYARLMFPLAGIDDPDTWPDPSPEFVRAEKEAGRQRIAQAQAVKDAAAADADAAYDRRLAEAEADSGADFAALADAALLDLAGREFPKGFHRAELRGLYRDRLLLRFHAERAQARAPPDPT